MKDVVFCLSLGFATIQHKYLCVTNIKWNMVGTMNLRWHITNLWLQNTIHRLFDVGFEHVRLGELLVPMGRQPDPGQGPLLVEHILSVKHGSI